jgi:benzoyl-CoA reductase/2-hydroxyglutaryl-CoA dehydratase subunit BcrC/BadD/HgdB
MMLVEPLKIWKECKALSAEYYGVMTDAKKQGKTLAWAGVGTPGEILRTMDIVPIYGEPYGAICGAAKLNKELLDATEQRGYGRNFCSYARSFIGSALINKGPLGEMPEPDLIISNKEACNTHISWWEVLSRHTDKPFYVIDQPLLQRGARQQHLNFMRAQVEGLIDFLQHVTGRKLDEDSFVEAVILSHEARKLWDQVLGYCKREPTLLNMKSQLSLMVPAVDLRGTQRAVDFYGRLVDELEDRANRGVAAVAEEEARILWDNVPLWYNLNLLNYLEEQGIVLVISPYTAMWGLETKYQCGYDEESYRLLEWNEPSNMDEAITEVAKHYCFNPLGADIPSQVTYYSNMVSDYSINGIISHSNRGCKNLSLNRVDVMKLVEKEMDIPLLIFEANMTDPSEYSDGQTKTRMDAFLEMLIF